MNGSIVFNLEAWWRFYYNWWTEVELKLWLSSLGDRMTVWFSIID